MEKQLVIYKVTNQVNGKIYIGQTQDFLKRQRDRKARAKSGKKKSYFDLAIVKYGWENFYWEIIDQCNAAEIDEKEKYWIGFYKSQDKNIGYNLAEGGMVNRGFKKTQEQKEKQSKNLKQKYAEGKIINAHKGKKISPEQKKKISETLKYKYKIGEITNPNKGVIVNEERKKKQSITLKNKYKNKDITPYWQNKKRAEDCRKKISETLKKKYKNGEIISKSIGKKPSLETIEKCKQTKASRVYKPTGKKIRCIETRIEYINSREASRQTGICYKKISAVLNKKTKHTNGLTWEFI